MLKGGENNEGIIITNQPVEKTKESTTRMTVSRSPRCDANAPTV